MAAELNVDTIAPETASEVTLNELASNSVNITGGTITGITDLVVADGGTGVSTLADGGILIGNVAAAIDVLAPGATTTILVGGGASTAPVWTTATGSGAPVRATSPALVTPDIGTPSAGVLTSCTGYPGTSLTVIAAKGDLLAGTANDTAAALTVGAAGTILQSRAAPSTGLAYVAALDRVIYGFTYANGTDAVNDLNIAAGGAIDSTNAYFMVGSALIKQSDAVWAVGTNAGMLDTGAVGDSDYYLYVIARSDTGVVDYICSLAAPATGPAMPASYDFFRAIGWFKRVSGTIVAFTTYETEGGGIEVNWNAPTLDVDLTTLSTSRLTNAVKVPLNFSTLAHLRCHVDDAGGAVVIYQCPDETDAAPSTTVAPGYSVLDGPNLNMGWQGFIRTSATGTMSARSTAAVDRFRVVTVGFTWARRN